LTVPLLDSFHVAKEKMIGYNPTDAMPETTKVSDRVQTNTW